MNLWEWAVGVYQRPGVEDAFLTLQNRYGQNVSFLLWAVWGAPDRSTLSHGAALAGRWDDGVLQPLRTARTVLATPDPPFDDDARLELREEVIAAELLAERVLMETLERLAPPSKAKPLDSLTAAAEVWGEPAPREALAELASAIS